MFDPIEAEQNEINLLLDKGMFYTLEGKKYLFKPPRLGTMIHLAEEFIKLDYNKAQLLSGSPGDGFAEQKRMILPNAVICARIIAVAYLRDGWRLRLLKWYYTRKFLKKITSKDLAALTEIILKSVNLPDFTNSIIMMSTTRVTAPEMIETKIPDTQEDSEAFTDN